jgi:hypothetical protein
VWIRIQLFHEIKSFIVFIKERECVWEIVILLFHKFFDDGSLRGSNGIFDIFYFLVVTVRIDLVWII